MSVRRRDIIALGAANAVLWVAIIFGIARTSAASVLGWDLSVFRDASRLLAAHRPLYDFASQAAAHREAFGSSFAVYYPYAYPPILALETMPLLFVSQASAFAIVVVASLGALVWAARRTGKIENALWVTVSYPAVYALLAGQLVFFALAIFTATFLLLRARRLIAAGLVASLLAYKPQLLIALPVMMLIVSRARRALVGLALGSAAQVALAFAVTPADALAFPGAVTDMAAYTETHFRGSLGFTWRAFFALIFPDQHAVATSLAVLAIVMCATVAVVALARARTDLPRAFSIAILATLACAWHCAPYDWVLLALPVWLLLPRVPVTKLGARVLVVAFALTWAFVPLVDAMQGAWRIAIHPAVPWLCAFSVWLVRARAAHDGASSS